MRSRRLSLLAALAVLVLWPAGAQASTPLHECQHPAMTGVEVYHLEGIRTAAACPVALALFSWETSSPRHQDSLYGCNRPSPDAAGYPYLRLHVFRGWKLSLTDGEFTMSRSGRSFRVTGTDFPLNCT
jgi:hypothetical protein